MSFLKCRWLIFCSYIIQSCQSIHLTMLCSDVENTTDDDARKDRKKNLKMMTHAIEDMKNKWWSNETNMMSTIAMTRPIDKNKQNEEVYWREKPSTRKCFHGRSSKNYVKTSSIDRRQSMSQANIEEKWHDHSKSCEHD